MAFSEFQEHLFHRSGSAPGLGGEVSTDLLGASDFREQDGTGWDREYSEVAFEKCLRSHKNQQKHIINTTTISLRGHFGLLFAAFKSMDGETAGWISARKYFGNNMMSGLPGWEREAESVARSLNLKKDNLEDNPKWPKVIKITGFSEH